MTISSGTTSKPLFRRRDAAVQALVEGGHFDIIERLRARVLRIEEVQRAFEAGDLGQLRAVAQHSLRLEDVLARQLERAEGLLEPGSIKAYSSLRNQLLERWGKDRDISTITTADVEAFLHEPKANAVGPKKNGKGRWKPKTPKPWSPGRQNTMRVIGGAVWDREITREMDAAHVTRGAPRLSRNPWKKAATKGIRRPRVAYLREAEWQEVEQWLQTNRPDQLALFALGALAGLRLGEALNLRTGIDMDMEARMVRVQPRTGEHKWRPKNRLGVRDVPMSDALHELLARHAEHFAGARYFIRLPGKDRPISQPVIQGWAREAFEAVGLRYGREGSDGLTFHSLRHSFASWLAQRRFTTREIAELIGDSPAEVDRTYAHLSPRNLQQAVQAVGHASRGEAWAA